jgi:hypothetical protein
MSTPIVFPDVELWATGYLRTALAAHGYPGTWVSNTYDGRETAVWVRRDGGAAIPPIRDAARVGVNVFSSTEFDVMALASVVSALLMASADGAPVVRALQLTGPSPIPDTYPRRYMTFELTTRGRELA